MLRRVLIVLSLCLFCSHAARADLLEIFAGELKQPGAMAWGDIYSECGIRNGRIESVGQVECALYKRGVFIAKNNPGAVKGPLEEWAAADLATRKEQEEEFTSVCYKQLRKADSYGTDIACISFLRGVLDEGLHRTPDGNFPGNPLAPAAVKKPAA
ncbi:hypothetical protein IGB42_04098 [Andreprevotia sp. IGB-42]|uniref:hypothetical protein n=1 Tax=Andreprevotia sp. IGB-42 TaxID=2497473 RepID=UPI0013586BB1|nr:hypothetical protein [Andreprevotia sp. IGB-42]KAF0811480.1 hypothetical protein IGB42_04098 [Andreprevotia sp. IGB-42]